MPLGKISFDVSSSLFIRELQARVSSFAQKPTIAYKIIVPDDL